jgi:CrcB protein
LNYFIVFLGAGIGGALRHGVNVMTARMWGLDFPFGTLVINIFGSLVMGLVVGYLAHIGSAPQSVRLFLMTGIIGGFTTFSAFSLETVMLYERSQWTAVVIYVTASVALSVGALSVGRLLFRAFTSWD